MNEQPRPSSATVESSLQSQKNLALVVYILQAAGVVIGLSAVIGVIVNYVKRSDVQGTYVASHFTWQIKTFWFTLLGMFVGALLVAVGVGALIILVVAIWYIYRVVRGWLALNDGKALPDSLI